MSLARWRWDAAAESTRLLFGSSSFATYPGGMRIVVLGAGFGGLELAAVLSDEFGEDLDLTLIDAADSFIFGFSKLDVVFGRQTPAAVRTSYSQLNKPGVRFVQDRVVAIDPETRVTRTEGGEYPADILVIALGANIHPEATPGLVEGGHEFYSIPGAFALRDVMADFAGGKVVVGVCSTPFKCPPAPSESVLLTHDYLTERGLRDQSEITLVMPFGRPVPPSPDASAALMTAFAERDIRFIPKTVVRSVDPKRRVAVTADGDELSFDLFLGIPTHRVPDVVAASGMTEDGWIPVDPLTMETKFPGVYALGDCTSVGTPKAGVFSEGQAKTAAARIADVLRDEQPQAEYDGHGICYVEFGHGSVAKVDVTFMAGQRPVGGIVGPSPDFLADKDEFGSSRLQRWFG